LGLGPLSGARVLAEIGDPPTSYSTTADPVKEHRLRDT